MTSNRNAVESSHGADRKLATNENTIFDHQLGRLFDATFGCTTPCWQERCTSSLHCDGGEESTGCRKFRYRLPSPILRVIELNGGHRVPGEIDATARVQTAAHADASKPAARRRHRVHARPRVRLGVVLLKCSEHHAVCRTAERVQFSSDDCCS